MRTAAHPGLYDVEAERPTLSGTRCARCGRVYFPPLTLGCEACGAPEDQLRPLPIAARGTIYSVARVHRAATPFTVAEIQLDDGPLIRALVSDGAAIGDEVHAVWSVTGDDVVEPVFTT